MTKTTITITNDMLPWGPFSIANILKQAVSFKSDIKLHIGNGICNVKDFGSICMYGFITPAIRDIVLTAEGPDENEAVKALAETMTSELNRVIPLIKMFEKIRKRKRVKSSEEIERWLRTGSFAYIHSYECQVSRDRIINLEESLPPYRVECYHHYAAYLGNDSCLPVLQLDKLAADLKIIKYSAVFVYRNMAFRSDPVKFMDAFEKLWYNCPQTDFIFGPPPVQPFDLFHSDETRWYCSLFEDAANLWNSQCFNLPEIYRCFLMYPK
jgi:phosphotransferase system HPr-like phosphotransfer protein